jgi:hypothetical protein
MNKEKGKNREFWLKTHNVATNYWGKGGKVKWAEFHYSYVSPWNDTPTPPFI